MDATISQVKERIFFLIRKHTQLSFMEIGNLFGGKDHSTILHAYRKIEGAVKRDHELSQTINTLETLLLAS